MIPQRRFALSSSDTAPVTAPILLTGDIANNIGDAAHIGYLGLEVHTRETAPLNYDEIMSACEAHGVAIAAVVTGRLSAQGQVNLMDDRPYITDTAIKGMLGYLEMAVRLKTNIIVGWVRGKIPDGQKAEPYMERLAQNLRIVCKQAKEEGVKIFLEAINRYEANALNTARETLDFINAWEIPNSYVHLDTFHMNIEETDPIEAIRMCGKKLGYFHVSDNTRCYPGSGALDFGRYLSALDEIGYQGYISVECLPKPDGKTAAKRALDHLLQCN